jgi:predicted RNA methylase
MIENIKKTKGFVETPKVIAEIMHFYLNLNENDKLLDVAAGKGALFLNHKKTNCFGCEIDIGNCAVLLEKGYINIAKGDLFEIENDFLNESMDAVILNPPFGKLENGKSSVDVMNIAINKLKIGGKFAIINQSNYNTKFNKEFENFKEKVEIEIGCKFANNLFLPFANVQTLLILGVKGKSKELNGEIWDFENDRILVEKRSKYVNIKLLKPKIKEFKMGNFWDEVNKINAMDTIPTLKDFKRTIIDYMAFESGLPIKFIENPELLGKALNYFKNKLNK